MRAVILPVFGWCLVNLFRSSDGLQPQDPRVWDALKLLRGRELTVQEIQDLYLSVIPGVDFPILADIPDDSSIQCGNYGQPGYYADVDTGRCQVFHRCDINGNLKSFLCPNMTLFNQITLICDWWYNVDCSKTKQFYDYSNSRLYQEGIALLDDQDDVAQSTGSVLSRASSHNSAQPKNQRRKKAQSDAPDE